MSPSPRRLSTRDWLSVVATLLAFGPLAWLHAIRLWSAPHYQFFPLLLAGLVWIGWQRWPEIPRSSLLVSHWASGILKAASLLLLFSAIAIYSPWLGAVAGLFAVAGGLLQGAGTGAIRVIAPLWMAAWLIIPPPLRIDEVLIHGLQRVASRSASQIADWLNIDHALFGNIIRLHGKDLLVDEACSGINSLLAALAVAALLAISRRRSGPHAVGVLAGAVFWVMAVNVLRIIIIVFVYDWYQWNWAAGTSHTLLGLAVLPLWMALVVATDLGLCFLFDPVFYPSSPLSMVWNRWIANPRSALVKVPTPKSLRGHNETPARGWCWLAGCSTLAVIQLGLITSANLLGSNADEAKLGSWQRTDFPMRLGEWSLRDYRTEERPSNSNLGKYSHVWEYAKGTRRLVVSLDYPFVGWHELSRCYAGQGWLVASRHVAKFNASEGAMSDIVEVDLRKRHGQEACLQFMLFDRLGNSITPPSSDYSVGVLMQRRVRQAMTKYGLDASTYQLQLLYLSDAPLNADERLEMRRMIVALKQSLQSTTRRNP